jgi:hypothetical protein
VQPLENSLNDRVEPKHSLPYRMIEDNSIEHDNPKERFEFDRKIGQGGRKRKHYKLYPDHDEQTTHLQSGYGYVCKAWDTKTKKWVAIKVLRPPVICIVLYRRPVSSSIISQPWPVSKASPCVALNRPVSPRIALCRPESLIIALYRLVLPRQTNAFLLFTLPHPLLIVLILFQFIPLYHPPLLLSSSPPLLLSSSPLLLSSVSATPILITSTK